MPNSPSLRADIAPPMDFTANAEWLAREVKATPMVLADRPRVAAAAIDAWTWLQAALVSRQMQREQRIAKLETQYRQAVQRSRDWPTPIQLGGGR